MNFRRWNSLVWLVFAAAAGIAACRRVYVVVPRPAGGYKPDTLRATLNGNDARVIFRFDTVTHTRTLYVTDTLYREGKQIIHDTVRLVRRDTVRIIRRDTVRVTRVDTVRVANGMSVLRDTVRLVRRDTVRIVRYDTVQVPHDVVNTIMRIDTLHRVDTVRVPQERIVYRTDTIRVMQPGSQVTRVDTVRLYRTDTLRLARVDTVRLVRVDTVRVSVASGGRTEGKTNNAAKRTLNVPPGQYPPEGQCRVWVQGVPPGRQRDPAPCDRLGDIPAGAFILFGGKAFDWDFDWTTEDGTPPTIVALQKQHGKKP